MTKSSHKKKPTVAKLPRATVQKTDSWFAPYAAVLPMPTLKSAKQVVRFANLSKAKHRAMVRAACEILEVRCRDWCKNGIYPDVGFIEGFLYQELPQLALLGNTP